MKKFSQIAMVGALAFAFAGTAMAQAGGGGSALGHIARSFIHSFKRPIVWAPLLGLAFSLAGWSLPSFAARSLDVMGTAAGGSALVLTGLVVSAQKFEVAWGTLIAIVLKNALQPALALGIAMLLHLPLEQMRYVVLISAMPCGFFGDVFGKVFDANPRLASSGLIASHVVSVGTLAAWIVIVDFVVWVAPELSWAKIVACACSVWVCLSSALAFAERCSWTVAVSPPATVNEPVASVNAGFFLAFGFAAFGCATGSGPRSIEVRRPAVNV